MGSRRTGKLLIGILSVVLSACVFADKAEAVSSDAMARSEVVAYVPEFVDASLEEYLRTVMSRLFGSGERKVRFAVCRNDFSDVDTSVPSVVCGLALTPENLRRFEFPLVPAGRRRIDIYAAAGDLRFTNGLLRAELPYRVGCMSSLPRMRSRFSEYAAVNGIPYSYEVADSLATLTNALVRGAIDVALLPASGMSGLRRVGACGNVEFHIVTPRGNVAEAQEISERLKALHLSPDEFILKLEQRCFHSQTEDSRNVRFGAYIERGICERGPDGEYTGLMADFVKRVAVRAGWNLTIVPLSFPEARQALKEGSVDLVGALLKTPERLQDCDYSDFSVGPLNYVLMTRDDGRMKAHDYRSWEGASIGLLAGSAAKRSLERYLENIGVRWVPRYYNDLADAENAVRAGELVAVFTLANNRNRDLRILTALPTELTYVGTNRRKSWVVRELNQTVAELLREDFQWLSRLYSRYLGSEGGWVALSPAEVAYIGSLRGRKISVSFDRALEPFVSVDPDTAAVGGFCRLLFEMISRRTGLDFELRLPGSKADVIVLVGDRKPDLDGFVVDEFWLPSVADYVKRRTVDVAVALSTTEDSRLKSILDKARDSIRTVEYDSMLFESQYSSSSVPPRTVMASPVGYGILFALVLIASVLLIVFRRRGGPLPERSVSVASGAGRPVESPCPPSVPARTEVGREASAAPSPIPAAGSDLASRRVLLVEDNPMNREIARYLLESMGLQVDEVVNGAEAVEKVRSSPPDRYSWVLMDIQMPVMNGYDAAREIRKFNRSVVIVAMTANAFSEDRAAALEAGMNEHLAKPIKAAVLESVLRKFA